MSAVVKNASSRFPERPVHDHVIALRVPPNSATQQRSARQSVQLLCTLINSKCAAKSRGKVQRARVAYVASTKHDEDAALIQRFAQQDDEAFKEFYNKYYDKVTAACYNRIFAHYYGKEPALTKAKDKATDILFHAYNNPNSYRPGEDVFHWLLSFSKTHIPGVSPLTFRANNRSFEQLEDFRLEPEDNSNNPADQENKTDIPETLDKNTKDAVSLIMNNINPRYAEALRLSANSNKFTHKEIGESLGGRSAAAAAGMIRNGRQAFCKKLLSLVDPKAWRIPASVIEVNDQNHEQARRNMA